MQRCTVAVAFALLLIQLIPVAALAGVIVPQSQASTNAPPLVLRRQQLAVTVRDQVARVTLDEQFENSTDLPLEGTYQLRLPEGAAVSGFATWVDGVRVESRIEEKSAAKATYDAAKADRQAPALLEQDAQLFKMHVDGIPARGTKRIEVSYAQLLSYDGGEVTLRLPIAEKGEPARSLQIDLRVGDQKRITSYQMLSGQQAKITADAEGGFALHFEGAQAPESELAIKYRTESSRMGLSFLTYKPAGPGDPAEDGYFLILASPQELTQAKDIVHKDVVFVFDTSGSMGNEKKIEQARQALDRCLHNLNAEDRFGIVAFSDSVNPFRGKLLDASAENVKAGSDFAGKLAASGGTDIHAALTKSFELLGDASRPHVIVFLTDGEPTSGITDPLQIASLIHTRNAGSARLFTFGVGSDVNRTFLEQLGNENRGSFAFVAPGQDIDAVVGGFYAKIARPVLSDLAFDFGEITTAMQYPDVLPDLYKGSQLVAVGRYRGSGVAKAKLVGTLNGEKHEIGFEARFPAAENESAFVARLWAQRRIDYLLAQARLHGEHEETKAEVIALSTRYQIVTPYTSLVAVKAESAVAMVYPARVRPGDPEVSIRAPRDARQVRVTLPWGAAKGARYDEARGLWVLRFLIPEDTADGTYPIRAEITEASGEKRSLALEISVDTKAPSLTASAGSVHAGEMIHLQAQAVVSPLEILSTLFERSDRYEAVKSLFDVRRATARLWDGREVELSLGGGLGFSGLVETSRALAPGRYPISITAQDFAGNLSRTEASVEVMPAAMPEVIQ